MRKKSTMFIDRATIGSWIVGSGNSCTHVVHMIDKLQGFNL